MKLYTAKTIRGAQEYARRLRRQLDDAHDAIENMAGTVSRLLDERIMLAKLAADGPCFDNPLQAHQAKSIRDTILKDECLAPDGTFLEVGSV